MSKAKNWHDIRLLSFDLQTVEFAYSEVYVELRVIAVICSRCFQNYTVSITCEDQISGTGGNFVLRFARRKLPIGLTSSSGDFMDVDIAEEDLFNPHDDAEPFLRPILRGKLAPSLNRLVTLLRETLPIVTELEAIRREEEKANRVVDAYPKAAGWYRLLYGDLRYNITH
jgi:mediator of RNA polymerase II transcription subunit 14